MEERFLSAMRELKVPGAAVAVVRDGEVLCARGFGVASVESGVPVTVDTLFRIGSVTKPLVGAAVMRLVEQGRLDLDLPVTRYFPWLMFHEPSAMEHVTLRMLLTHTAGLLTDVANHGSRDPAGLERFLREELPQYPLVAPPGRVCRYSNLGFAVVGHVLETVCGEPVSEVLRELVFEPLGMARTTLDPAMAMTYPLAQGHEQVKVVRPAAENTAFAPAGFAWSTVQDLARFVCMLLAEGGDFLRPATVQEMRRRHVRSYGPADGGRGLALFVDPHPRSGLARYGHMGGITGYRALMEVYPESRSGVVVLINQAQGIGQLRDVLLEQCLGLPTSGWAPATGEPDRARWSGFCGTYLSESEGLAEVRVEGEALLLIHHGEACPLTCSQPDLYVAPRASGGYLGVGFPAADYLMVDETPFRRINLPGAVDTQAWERYAGVYRGSGLPITVRVADGRLWLHSATYRVEECCTYIGEESFACRWGSFTFAPNGMLWSGFRFIPRVGA